MKTEMLVLIIKAVLLASLIVNIVINAKMIKDGEYAHGETSGQFAIAGIVSILLLFVCAGYAGGFDMQAAFKNAWYVIIGLSVILQIVPRKRSALASLILESAELAVLVMGGFYG